MKLITKSLSLTAAALAAGTMLFGAKDTLIRIRAGLEEVRQVIDGASSSSHLVALARAQLDSADRRLQDAEATMHTFGARAEKAQSALAHLGECANATRVRLGQLQPALNGEAEAFRLHGVTYTQAEVEAEARRLLAALDSYHNQSRFQSAQLEELRRALAASEKELAGARVGFDSAKGRLAEVELKLKTEEAKAVVATAASGSLDSLTAEFKGGFSRSLNELEARLNRLQISNERALGSTSHKAGGIAWGAEALPLRSAVDGALGGSKPTDVPRLPTDGATQATPPPAESSKTTVRPGGEAPSPSTTTVPAAPIPPSASRARGEGVSATFTFERPTSSCRGYVIVTDSRK